MITRVMVGVGAGLLVSVFAAGPSRGTEADPLPAISLDHLLTIAHVDAPPEGTGLLIYAHFPAEAPLDVGGEAVYALTADITPDGTAVTRNAVTAASTRQDEGMDECNDPAFVPTGVTWADEDLPLEWWFRRTSTPDGVAESKTKRALRKAHQVWGQTVTECDSSSPNTFHFAYQGAKPNPIGYDELNVVDFGALDGALAVSYTWYRGTRIVEVDLRFNKVDFRWTNLARLRSRYQVINVATHEIGHHLGLDDLSDPHGALTMFGKIGKGEMSKATLGRGDMKGAETLSP